MAIRSVGSATYSDDRTIGASGEDVIEFPHACSSIMILLQTNIGDVFTVILNEDEDQGEGIHNPVTFNSGAVITVNDYRIDTVTVRSTNGSNWGYMAYVNPGTGLGFSEVS